MTLLGSVRLVRQLNAMINDRAGIGPAAAAVVGADVAHHVLDPDGLGGLDQTRATALVDALPEIIEAEREGWLLALPAPGRLSVLRGPADLNRAAIDAGAAVVGLTAGVALVPQAVGPAVQWRLYRAERPAAPPSPYEAERALGETILSAGRTLALLDVAGGPTGARPGELSTDLGPAPGYPPRRRVAADRAARLLLAVDLALQNDGASLSAYEIAIRRRELDAVREAARDALTSAVSWPLPAAAP